MMFLFQRLDMWGFFAIFCPKKSHWHRFQWLTGVLFRITWPIPSPVQLTRSGVEVCSQARHLSMVFFHGVGPVFPDVSGRTKLHWNKHHHKPENFSEIIVSRSSMFLLFSENNRNLIYTSKYHIHVNYYWPSSKMLLLELKDSSETTPKKLDGGKTNIFYFHPWGNDPIWLQ